MAKSPDKINKTEQKPTDDQEVLIEQARAAADQAIELARLAQESAKLARDLNRRAMGEDGNQLESVPIVTLQTSPAAETVPTEEAATSPTVPVEQPILPAPPATEPALPQLASAGLPAVGTALPATSRSKRKPKNNRDALRKRVERTRRHKLDAVVPKKVRIKVRKGDLDREEGLVPFLRENWNSMTASGVVLTLVLAFLAFQTLEVIAKDPINTVMASFSDEEADVEEDIPVEQPEEEDGEQLEEETEEPVEEPDPEPEPEAEPEMVEEPPAEEVIENPESTEPPMVDKAEPGVDFSKEGSRSTNAKQALLAKYGGSAASESAVGNALEWFANHQRRDGSWNFNDVGESGNAGSVDNPMAATSYVLLAYLGAGQTHKEGKYKKNVEAGISFLLKWGRPVGQMVDFSGVSGEDDDTHERFYSHGAAVMALMEAYHMTKDRRLRGPAQGGLAALIAAQDPQGGGWEYVPYAPGTTSVTGLQITALMSAKKAGFKIPPQTLQLASKFLDSVQSDDGGDRYGYTARKPSYKSSVTAIAILCRQYLGWKRDDPVHKKAIALLDKKGPNSDSLYYIYYATQAMRNYGGKQWEDWNADNREDLVRRQETEGDAAGSWPTRNRALEAKAGGRLFMTVLATLTLEVYYRYLPLYDEPGGKTAGSKK